MLSLPEGRLALSRLANGHDPVALAAICRDGLPAWLEAQSKPDEARDEAGAAAVARARLRIRYAAGEQWTAADESRALTLLAAPQEQLWPLADPKLPAAEPERNRPRQDVAAATIARAMASRWQLREVLADFWHNHFSVNAAGERSVGVCLPAYDRNTIRPHVLGSFRALLGAVATAPAMLVYLNNRSSRAGAPNENFARELLELHTLGRDFYVSAAYRQWRDVPGAAEGRPQGYIDEDVYEAARALTGWGIADGATISGSDRLPVTGHFTYVAAWHDNYQKRILGREYASFAGARADGERLLDELAAHPATARHVTGKLVVHLIGATPPQAILAAAEQAWRRYDGRDDQIYQTVRAIALTPAFLQSQSRRVKRPLELAASFVRAGGLSASFAVTEGVLGEMDGSGQRLFGWPSPTGHPDGTDYWLSSYAMRRRVSLVFGLAENWWQSGALSVRDIVQAERLPAGDLLRRIEARFLPGLQLPDRSTAVLSPLDLEADTPLAADDRKARRLVAAVALYPEFQWR